MPWRSRFSSLVVLGAALSLGSCSKADWRDVRADWREGIERPEDCIVRMNALSEELVSPPAAQHFRWVPTFRFDMTAMDQEAVDELVASTGAHVMTPSERGLRDGNGELPAALVYSQGDT